MYFTLIIGLPACFSWLLLCQEKETVQSRKRGLLRGLSHSRFSVKARELNIINNGSVSLCLIMHSAKWKAAIINVINYTCDLVSGTRQNVHRDKGLLSEQLPVWRESLWSRPLWNFSSRGCFPRWKLWIESLTFLIFASWCSTVYVWCVWHTWFFFAPKRTCAPCSSYLTSGTWDPEIATGHFPEPFQQSSACPNSFARGTGSQEWRQALFIEPIQAPVTLVGSNI